MSDIETLFASIKVLPPAPQLLPRLLPALADLNSNFDEVVNLIEIDPALTSKLLQICNSAYFGNANPVEDVRQAVQRIGFQSISLLAAMIEGGEFFKAPEVPGMSFKSLWRHSVMTAYAAGAVAESANLETGLVFTAGLMHDIGKIILACAYGKDYGQVLIRAAETATPAFEAERAEYGYNHADVGARLLSRWKLSGTLVSGVRFHHQPARVSGSLGRIAACVCAGDFLAHAEENPGVLECEDFKSAVSLLGLSPSLAGHWQTKLRDSHRVIDSMSPKVDMATSILLGGAMQSRGTFADDTTGASAAVAAI